MPNQFLLCQTCGHQEDNTSWLDSGDGCPRCAGELVRFKPVPESELQQLRDDSESLKLLPISYYLIRRRDGKWGCSNLLDWNYGSGTTPLEAVQDIQRQLAEQKGDDNEQE